MPPASQPATAQVGHNSGEPPPELMDKINRWFDLKTRVAALVAEEAELRREIVSEAFTDAEEKGTHRRPIGFGKDLKATTKVNYTVNRELFDAAMPSLSKEVVDQVIKYEPKVIESGLNKVADAQVKALLSTFITARPGLPQLEISDVKKR